MRIIHGISNLLLGGLLLLLFILWAPKFWGYEVFYVSSGSMEPEIHVGDAIFVKQCDFKEVRVEDIVTYSMNGGQTIITHRVVSLDEERGMLQTKGDANEQSDEVWIKSDLLLGKVEYHVPWLGHLTFLLSSVFGKLLIGGIFLWLIALQLLLEQWIVPEVRKEKAR